MENSCSTPPASWGSITASSRRTACRTPSARHTNSRRCSPPCPASRHTSTPASTTPPSTSSARTGRRRITSPSRRRRPNSSTASSSRRLLYDAIDELPERYRRIFELNFQQGLKNAEIAALLGVTESAVKKQKAAMIDLVRQSLKKKTGNDLLAFLIVMKYLVP